MQTFGSTLLQPVVLLAKSVTKSDLIWYLQYICHVVIQRKWCLAVQIFYSKQGSETELMPLFMMNNQKALQKGISVLNLQPDFILFST